MIGKVIKNNYRIMDEIGQGSVATTYLAKDMTYNTVVALKILHPERAAEGQFLQRFQGEAKLLQMLSSPQAVKVLDYGEDEGLSFIVFEYVQGRTLASILEEEGPLEVNRALDIAGQVTLCLVDAHAKSIIHRDLRPANVMITAEGNIKVMDSGIARGAELGKLMVTGALGSPHYLSPEQTSEGEVDSRSDIYSLGVILFEMLSGKKPYDADSAEEIVQAHQHAPIPSLRQLVEGIPPEVDGLVTKCLAKEPGDRYQSAAEFLETLDGILRMLARRKAGATMVMASLIGQTVGAYRIIEQVGRGGMATVYKAYEPALDRYVAIKVLPEYFAHDPDFVSRFEREARAVAKLNHPNILPIYSFGQEAGLTYIAMRYVEAGTLKEMLGQPLDLKTTADILGQIGQALHYAHQRGIVHRDVKPTNVLMAEGPVLSPSAGLGIDSAEGKWALLTDFGLARMVESSVQLTKTGVGMGTPAYMSPEQGRGLRVDARSDVYSLGVMLYEMVTGQVPYDAETPMAIVIKHMTAPLPLPRSMNPDLPEAVERVILKALAKDPEDRYQTTAEMLEALEKAVAEAPVTERPAEGVPPAEVVEPAPAPMAAVPVEAPPVAKKGLPGWAWGVIGALGLVIVAAGVFFATRGRMPSPTPEATATLAATPTSLAPAPSTTSPPSLLTAQMRIRLTSTSDWTSLTLLSGDDIVQHRTVGTWGVTTVAEMLDRTINVDQQIQRAEVGHAVHIAEDVTLAGVTEGQDLRFKLEKGCLGETTVEVFNLETDIPILVERFWTAECDPKTFTMDVGALVTERPTPLATAMDTWSWEQDGGVMVYVPAGTFWMGSDDSDPNAGGDEKPQHEVYLDGFWIDQTEVTNAQYQRCVDAGVCDPPAGFNSFTRDNYYANPEYSDYPVILVNRNQADTYCRWTGKRLPTEAEWEKTARGTDKRIYPWGNDFDGERLNFCDVNYPDDSRDANWDDGYADTAPVGSYPAGASPYGALDMAGNVYEWVADWVDGEYYESALRRARGGAYTAHKEGNRAASRGTDDPVDKFTDVGFRCAYSESEPTQPMPAPPDEGKIVGWCEGVTPPQLCVRDVKTGQVTQLTYDLDLEMGVPSWSPDGQQILFPAGSAQPDHNLYTINADGSGLKQLTSGDTHDQEAEWSPDGEWIAFYRDCNLWRIRPDGSDEQALLVSDEYCTEIPTWSPDSQQIAFLYFQDGLARGIWTVNQDGSDSHEIYAFERQPDRGGGVWGPDGRQILSCYEEDGEWPCILVNADGSGEAQRVDWELYWWGAGFWPRWGRVDYLVVREVSVDLGTTNQEYGLVQVEDTGDGLTAPATIGGQDARVMVPNETEGRYIYFDVDDDFLFAQETHVRVTVEYFDLGDFYFEIEYDSKEDFYKGVNANLTTHLENTNQWKTAIFDLPDAYFGGRQHDQFDFRITAGDNDLYVNTVTVTKP